MSDTVRPGPLKLRGCAFTALSTGEKATNLKELRDRILRVPVQSLYYHFWGRLLRPVLEQHNYVNDFGNWVGHELRDWLLAERLALVDPGDETDIETLRDRLSDLLEEHLANGGRRAETADDGAFHFIEGQMVIFDAGREVRTPAELARILPDLDGSIVYYHVIDARHRSPGGRSDFEAWLAEWGEPFQPLVDRLGALDVYFTPLSRLQQDLARLLEAHLTQNGTAAP